MIMAMEKAKEMPKKGEEGGKGGRHFPQEMERVRLDEEDGQVGTNIGGERAEGAS